MIEVVIVGQGGHSKVIHDIVLANQHMKVVGHLDDKFTTIEKRENVFFGPVSSANQLLEEKKHAKFVIGIGNNAVRKIVEQKLQLNEEQYISIIHPNAVVSKSAIVGFGTVIMPNAVVNSDVKVGNHVIINTGAIIEHDNVINDYVHVSPNATLTGTVNIGEGTHICAGATIIPNISIGEWSVIGAGATVIHHIPARCTAVGIPAIVKSKEGEKVV